MIATLAPVAAWTDAGAAMGATSPIVASMAAVSARASVRKREAPGEAGRRDDAGRDECLSSLAARAVRANRGKVRRALGLWGRARGGAVARGAVGGSDACDAAGAARHRIVRLRARSALRECPPQSRNRVGEGLPPVAHRLG
jgi:hypothetical protein